MRWNPATRSIDDTDQIRRKLLKILEFFLGNERFHDFQYLYNIGSDDDFQIVGPLMDLDTLRAMIGDGSFRAAEAFITEVLRITRDVKKYGPLAEYFTP